ncbi:hypothetical protein [Streptacidiphilus sp. EB103A]|jgi:hypothetical protein|uniref:hypothetical protein n=1 Tax=Streptacidiphilus sp. EB103A TaxID=3156275 RepID=UPI0035179031
MWVRGVGGVLLIVLGAVWVAQGTGAVHGSMMSGHSQYAALGALVILAGVALLGWAWRVRAGRSRDGR